MPDDARPLVSRLVQRSRVYLRTYRQILAADESAFSPNALTGYSVNVPIVGTCQPSKVCAETCYAAASTLSTPDAIRRQSRVQTSQDVFPQGFAARVVAEYDRLALPFLRWNGSGDLTAGAVAAINAIGKQRPDVRLWVVSRKPALAALIEEAPRVFLQFSLDGSSMERREKFLALQPRTSRYFFSYQCAKGEVPPEENLRGISVVYHNRNVFPPAWERRDADCPICGPVMQEKTCHDCQRCFNGEAVAMRQGAPTTGRAP